MAPRGASAVHPQRPPRGARAGACERVPATLPRARTLSARFPKTTGTSAMWHERFSHCGIPNLEKRNGPKESRWLYW